MIFSSDTFTGTDATVLSSHTGETGAAWAAHPSSANNAVLTNASKLRGDGAGLALYYASGSPATAEYDVDVGFTAVVGATGLYYGVAGRIDVSADTYYVAYYDKGAVAWALAKFVAGAGANLGSASAILTHGQTYALKLQIRDGTKKVFVNAVEVISSADNAITAAGKAGVYVSGQSTNSTGYHLDNFSANDTSVPATDTIAVNDANLFLSPYNWRMNGSTYAQTNNPGAYVKTKFTGTSVGISVDVSMLTGVSAGDYPTILYSVDNSPFTRLQLASVDTDISLASGLADTTHDLLIILVAATYTEDRWTAPEEVLRITGILVDPGEGLAAPTLLAGRAIIFADSNGEGYEALGTGYAISNQDASQAWPLLTGWALGCEVGVIAFAGQGYTVPAGGNVPDLEDSWDFYSDGQSRLSGGLLTPSPDFLFVGHGQNDSSGVQTALTNLLGAWRTAAPPARILTVLPTTLGNEAAIRAAVTAVADSNTAVIDYGSVIYDGTAPGRLTFGNHLSARGHAVLAAFITASAKPLTTGGANPLIPGFIAG